jgi:hypothetical protein
MLKDIDIQVMGCFPVKTHEHSSSVAMLAKYKQKNITYM